MQKSHQTLITEGLPVDTVLMGITMANPRDGPKLTLLNKNKRGHVFSLMCVKSVKMENYHNPGLIKTPCEELCILCINYVYFGQQKKKKKNFGGKLLRWLRVDFLLRDNIFIMNLFADGLD